MTPERLAVRLVGPLALALGATAACEPAPPETRGPVRAATSSVSPIARPAHPADPSLPEAESGRIVLLPDSISEVLFSYTPAVGSFTDWVELWMNQTLARDGYQATARAVLEADTLYLALEGSDPRIPEVIELYQYYLFYFLVNGYIADRTIDSLKTVGAWPAAGADWRFMLPLGLPMLNQRSVQFFHYPPERLLTENHDYLGDPVPYRWEQLLAFNGVRDSVLYERIIDGAPIAAPDSVGAQIPIGAFTTYQTLQLYLFLRPFDTERRVTIPLVAYGVPAMATLEKNYGINLAPLVAQTSEIIDGWTTPVLGANHPYHFYATAQVFPPGNGQLGPGCRMAADLMRQDVIAACWQAKMAADPTQEPFEVIQSCADEWYGPARAADFCTLVQHEGSLAIPAYHPGVTCPGGGDYCFLTSLSAAADFCGAHANDPCALAAPPR